MNPLIARHHRLLRLPAGAPEAGEVRWQSTDLFSASQQVLVRWDEDNLLLEGAGSEGSWTVLFQQAQGWKDPSHRQGVPEHLFKPKPLLDWVAARIQECALGCHPICSWEIPRGPRRRR